MSQLVFQDVIKKIVSQIERHCVIYKFIGAANPSEKQLQKNPFLIVIQPQSWWFDVRQLAEHLSSVCSLFYQDIGFTWKVDHPKRLT